jgi:hypothetical protein
MLQYHAEFETGTYSDQYARSSKCFYIASSKIQCTEYNLHSLLRSYGSYLKQGFQNFRTKKDFSISDNSAWQIFRENRKELVRFHCFTFFTFSLNIKQQHHNMEQLEWRGDIGSRDQLL